MSYITVIIALINWTFEKTFLHVILFGIGRRITNNDEKSSNEIFEITPHIGLKSDVSYCLRIHIRIHLLFIQMHTPFYEQILQMTSHMIEIGCLMSFVILFLRT